MIDLVSSSRASGGRTKKGRDDNTGDLKQWSSVLRGCFLPFSSSPSTHNRPRGLTMVTESQASTLAAPLASGIRGIEGGEPVR